jgi:hypothetical protein
MKPRQPTGAAGTVSIPAENRFWEMRGASVISAYLFSYQEEVRLFNKQKHFMPIKFPDKLPAKEILQNENIFVMDENWAIHQDIRPLKVAILNLMPTKIATETQLLRLLGNTAIQIEATLVRTRSHQSKNTPEEHLITFYKTFDQIRD